MNYQKTIEAILLLPESCLTYDPIDICKKLRGAAPELAIPKAHCMILNSLCDRQQMHEMSNECKTAVVSALRDAPPTIRSIRTTWGCTQAQLSERFNISRRTVEDWDAGRRTPPPYVPLMMLEILTGMDVKFG